MCLGLSGLQNEGIYTIWGRLCFFGRLRLKRKEGVTRITESKRDRIDGHYYVHYYSSQLLAGEMACSSPR